MNAKQRYDFDHPIISFRIDRNLKKIINQYIKKHEIETVQDFMNIEFLDNFRKKHTEFEYKLKD